MSTRLDELLAAMAADRPRAELSQMEAQVWRRIGTDAAPGGGWSWRAAAAAIGLLLGFGVSTAGAAVRPATDLDVFSAAVPQAPSSLLGLTH